MVIVPSTITFKASFPDIQSAIKRGRDGMRIQLDIPESEMASAVLLLGLMNKVLEVTVKEAARTTPKLVKSKDFTVKGNGDNQKRSQPRS